MPKQATIFTALVASTGLVLGQAPSATAEVLAAGSSQSYVTSNFASPVIQTAAPPAGPAAFGTVWSNQAQDLLSYSESLIEVEHLSLDPQAVLGFRVTGQSLAVTDPPAGPFSVTAGTSMVATVRMSLTAPNQVGGRLFLRYTGSIADLGAAEIGVDVGADGTIEHVVDAATFLTGEWREREFPVVLGPTPLQIDLHLNHFCGTSSVNSQFSGHSAMAQMEVQFFPGQPAVEWFDATGAQAGIVWQHAPDDTVTVGVATPGLAGGVIVIGAQPTSASITPWVTQLVTIDAVVFQSSMTVSMPTLPPGSALYCQGLAWDGGGILRSTPSLRALWP